MPENAPKIKLLRHAHVHYLHPDLALAQKFLIDFGLIEVSRTADRIFYRGYGVDPYCYVAERSSTGDRAFGGGAFVVDSRQDLIKASKLPGASSIQECDAPGGGSMVVLKDPNNMAVKLIYGQQTVEPMEPPKREKYNTAWDKDRVGQFHRFSHGPSKVHKVGHYGFMVSKDRFEETRQWYLDTFNFKLTDSVYDPKSGEDDTSFCHIDLGEEYTDHHGIFLSCGLAYTGDSAQIHHSSFEVHDVDSQNLGHQWLQDHGWINSWGVGRHLLGSQLFDYWFDASGFILEHYADGDLVNCHTEYTRQPAAKHSLYVWGPNVPKAFISANVEDVAQVPALQPQAVPT